MYGVAVFSAFIPVRLAATLNDGTCESVKTSGGNATATVTFAGGAVEYTRAAGSSGTISAGYDCITAGDPADAEIMATATGDTGSLTGSSLSTWLNMGTSRSWTMTSLLTEGQLISVLTITVRKASTGATLAGPNTVTLIANRS